MKVIIKKILLEMLIFIIVVIGALLIKLGNNDSIFGVITNFMGGVIIIYPSMQWYSWKFKNYKNKNK